MSNKSKRMSLQNPSANRADTPAHGTLGADSVAARFSGIEFPRLRSVGLRQRLR
jgi:hypothetical protein